MSLVETLTGTIVGIVGGSFLGYGFSILGQNRSQRLQRTEMARERIYSPLYDEIGEMTQDISSREWWPTDEWKRVSEGEHLSYLIDLELLQSLRRFYGQSLESLTKKANACTDHYPSVVVAEMHRTLAKATP